MSSIRVLKFIYDFVADKFFDKFSCDSGTIKSKLHLTLANREFISVSFFSCLFARLFYSWFSQCPICLPAIITPTEWRNYRWKLNAHLYFIIFISFVFGERLLLCRYCCYCRRSTVDDIIVLLHNSNNNFSIAPNVRLV